MELKHTEQFIERFNDLVKNCNWSEEDKLFMNTWKTHMSIALINDLGLDLADDISNIISSVCTYENRED